MSTDPPVLNNGKASGRSVAESPSLALLLCAPGAACFVLYFGGFGGPGLFLGVLLAAVLTAVVSLFLYRKHARRGLRWYALLNLGINVTGLLLVAVSLVGMAGEGSIRLARGVRLLSEDHWADIVGVPAACVIQPLIACLCVKFSLWLMPGSTGAQAQLYGVATLLFTPFAFFVLLIAWLLGRLGVLNVEWPFWWVFAAPAWVALMGGVPYLYVRRRLRHERAARIQTK